MPLVISKNQIDNYEKNKQHLARVDTMKENKQINREVNPPKPPKMIKMSRPPPAPRPKAPPKHILELLQKRKEENEYKEYKESLNKILSNVLSRAEPNENYNATLQNKISSSNDLKKILKNKVIDYTSVDNEFIIFCLTLLGYYAENRLGI